MTNKNSNKALTTMTQMFGTQGSPNTFWFQTPKSLDIVTWDPTTDAFTNQNMADIFTQSTLLELGIMPDVLTTAGDLVYYNGITTKPTRFPIGTQGTFLMSNNSGLGSTPGWKNPGPAVNTSVNTTTNQWYTGPTTAGLSTLVLTANELYAIPIFIAQPHVISGIGVHFTSASTGTVRCGIYNDNILNPLSLLKDSGRYGCRFYKYILIDNIFDFTYNKFPSMDLVSYGIRHSIYSICYSKFSRNSFRLYYRFRKRKCVYRHKIFLYFWCASIYLGRYNKYLSRSKSTCSIYILCIINIKKSDMKTSEKIKKLLWVPHHHIFF